jgi:hypothetical protein
MPATLPSFFADAYQVVSLQDDAIHANPLPPKIFRPLTRRSLQEGDALMELSGKGLI